MNNERREELRKALLKAVIFSSCVGLGFSIGRCVGKIEGKEELNSTKTYYAAPIAMTNGNGETTYVAPEGFVLAFDETGKPYCYKTIITDEIKTKALKKSK